MEADYNHDHYATRTISGEVVFNPVRLAELVRHCDDFRINFRHPVPRNFQRMGVTVVQGEDGATVNYEITDTERPMNIGVQSGITNITCERSVSFSGSSPVEALASAAGGGLGTALANINSDDLNNAFSRRRGRSFIGSRNVMRSAALGFIQGASSGVAGALPTIILGVNISVSGNRNASKKTMLRSALSLLANRTADFIARFDPHLKISASFDDAGKSVAVNAQYVVSGLGAAGALLAAGFVNIWSVGVDAANVNNITPQTVAETAITQLLVPGEEIGTGTVTISNADLVTNPAFPNSGGMRGTWLEKIVAQSLSEACQEPPSAPLSSNANDLVS